MGEIETVEVEKMGTHPVVHFTPLSPIVIWPHVGTLIFTLNTLISSIIVTHYRNITSTLVHEPSFFRFSYTYFVVNNLKGLTHLSIRFELRQPS